ncbi:MAG TPA: SH3 domain-containing protein [Verrucomicrobiae bacterium]|nr:SH3 domain-containing protein [Verrucomicrobiae bacterium]
MKKKFGLILATMVSAALLAQTPPPGGNPSPSTPPPLPAAPDTSTQPATPPPSVAPLTPPDAGTTTNAPAKKKTKKKTAKKKTTKEAKAAAPEMPAEPLVPGEPAVAKQNNVNIRGQAHINSEVVGHLQKGDTVTVLEEVTLKHPKTDEPSKWAKIALPGTLHVWVNAPFIDATNQTVTARKLNLRTGPGENYSVIGTLQKGDAVKTAGNTKGDWTQIEAPTNAFAFVAAHLLTHKAPEPAAPTNPPPTQVAVGNPPPVAPPSTETPGSVAPPPPNVPLPPIAPPPAPAVEEPPPPRIIEREGLVGGSVSIQAPSHYELKSLDDGTIMDYLYTTSTNLSLARYRGLTVLVTGEEELDERWPNTPVLTIQKIQVVK